MKDSTKKSTQDVIRQSELAAFFEYLAQVQRRVLVFRKRIDAGAVVEFGPIAAEVSPSGPDPTPVLECDEIELYGLRIGPIESSYAVMSAQMGCLIA